MSGLPRARYGVLVLGQVLVLESSLLSSLTAMWPRAKQQQHDDEMEKDFR